MTAFVATSRPRSAHTVRVRRAPQNRPLARVRAATLDAATLVVWLLGSLLGGLLSVPRTAPTYLARVRRHGALLVASVRDALPWTAATPEARAWRRANLRHALRDVPVLALGILFGSRKNYGVLRLELRRASGERLALGVVSHQLITTAGVNKLVAGLNGTDAATFGAFRYHGIGTGATAPAVGDTALQAEATAALNPDNTRATGTQGTGAAANVYRTVGTVTVDAPVACTEMGLFSQAATGGGTLLDRFTFAVVNLAAGDSLQTTVDITLPAGS